MLHEELQKPGGGSLTRVQDAFFGVAMPEGSEGMVLLHTMIGNFGALAGESRMARTMAAMWQAECKAADKDGSGTISKKEAEAVWDKIVGVMEKMVASKIKQLSAA